jgi:GGDEF domain-containing protein/PAS domain-containing protein
MPDQLRRPRSPLQLALGGAGRAHHGRRGADPALHGTQVRRALLGNQLYLLEGMGGDDAAVAATVGAVERDLRPIDRALARAKADPSHASLTAEAERMRPAIRRITVRVKELYDAKGQGFFGAYATLTAEVDERKAAERALRASEERFRALVQNSSDVISIVDADGASATTASRCSATTRPSWSTATRSPGPPRRRERVARFVAEAALRPGVTAAETWRVRHRDGTWLHSETVAANLLEDPNVRGLVLNTRDVSDRKELEAQLVHQAFHDGLTGLANRTLSAERVEHALARTGHGDLAVLFIDLDDFKHVNDSLGHAAGDQLLVAAAGGSRAAAPDRHRGPPGRRRVRRAAGAGRRRRGGGGGRRPGARHPAPAVRPQRPHHPDQGQPGRGHRPARADEAEELLRNADVAMYAAKARGKDRYELIRPDMHEDMLQRLELEAELRHVADRDQLVLHYQPIVELVSGRITRLEALVRWDHPTKGLLAPPAFIPLAEEQG